MIGSKLNLQSRVRIPFVFVVFVVTLFASKAHSEPLKMLSSWGDNIQYVPQIAVRFIREVDEQSEGRIEIIKFGPEVVPAMEQLEPVSSEAFDMLFTNGSYHSGTTPLGLVLDTLNPNPKATRAGGIYDLLDEHYQHYNLKLLCVCTAGPTGFHFLLTDPVEPSGNLAGRKIRSSPTYRELIRQLGASPVNLGASQIYSAMEKGVVDGLGWPLIAANALKFHEVATHMARPTFGTTGLPILMNLDTWLSLSRADQKVLLDAARTTEIEGFAAGEVNQAEEIEGLIANGMEVTYFGAEHDIRRMYNASVWTKIDRYPGELPSLLRTLAEDRNLLNQ